jgi:hypothetical protein
VTASLSNSVEPMIMVNYLMLMDWIDERRIEMQAEGRRHWVPSSWDFEQAMRDCWDDLVGQPSQACALACEGV